MFKLRSLLFGALVACSVSSGLHAVIQSLNSVYKHFHKKYYKDLYNLNFERLEELRNKENLSLDAYNRESMKEDAGKIACEVIKEVADLSRHGYRQREIVNWLKSKLCSMRFRDLHFFFHDGGGTKKFSQGFFSDTLEWKTLCVLFGSERALTLERLERHASYASCVVLRLHMQLLKEYKKLNECEGFATLEAKRKLGKWAHFLRSLCIALKCESDFPGNLNHDAIRATELYVVAPKLRERILKETIKMIPYIDVWEAEKKFNDVDYWKPNPVSKEGEKTLEEIE